MYSYLCSQRRIQKYVSSFLVTMRIHGFFLQIVDNAEAQYLAFFAGKTIGMIRAPDSYVFPAPFNIVEIFLVAPFECVISFLLSY
jgi:hypothetical protein